MWELLGWLHPTAASLGMIHGQGSLLILQGLRVLVICNSLALQFPLGSCSLCCWSQMSPTVPIQCHSQCLTKTFLVLPLPGVIDEPKRSLGSPLVGQVGFAVLKFPHLAGVEDLFIVQ